VSGEGKERGGVRDPHAKREEVAGTPLRIVMAVANQSHSFMQAARREREARSLLGREQFVTGGGVACNSCHGLCI